jgi:hypothetical protein
MKSWRLTMWISVAVANDQEYPAPSWDKVESVIRSLDGSSLSDVFLYGRLEDEFMAISGGNEGRYRVGIQDNSQGYYLLLDSRKGTEEVLVKVADLDDYVASQLVHDLATALTAARTYFDTGRRDARFDWKKGGKR